jgi:hypothetical protein
MNINDISNFVTGMFQVREHLKEIVFFANKLAFVNISDISYYAD